MLAFENSSFLKNTLRITSISAVALLAVIISDSEATGEYKEIFCIGLIIFFAIMFLALTFPKKLAWAYRGFALLVFISYLWYFIDIRFIEGEPFTIESNNNSQTSLNALRGLILYGIPGLLYFILGTTRSERKKQIKLKQRIG